MSNTLAQIYYKKYYVRIRVYKKFYDFLCADVCEKNGGKFMITLELLRECDNCPEFEVHQNTQCADLLDGRTICYHTVTCEHIEKCRNLIEYLRKDGK